MEENVAIEVRDVRKIYKLYDRPQDRMKEAFGFGKKKIHRLHYALNGVSFNIYRGETAGIIGTNGSGKSTILKIITGVLNPTQGEVQVDGRISALLELGAGFNMEYTGVENIYLNAAILGYTKKEIDEKLNDIIEFSELGDFIYSPIKTYSSGMMARLGFSIAVNMESEILLIDEILAVGDIAFNKKCHAKLAELQQKGLTFLIVSHGEAVKRYCKRAIWLDGGLVREDGDINTVFKHYTEAMTRPKPAPQPAAAAPSAHSSLPSAEKK